jgi:hypothetical protein
MSRRRASELYQVDFVAALFGGFLLVWLSSIGEAEFPGSGDGRSLTIFEVSAVAYFPGAPELAWSVAPAASFRSGCAHPRLVAKLVNAGLAAAECQNGATVELKAGKDSGNLYARAQKYAENAKSLQHKATDSAFVPVFDVIFSTPSADEQGLPVGGAFSTATGAPKLTQIGIRPQGSSSNAPQKLLLKEWQHRSFMILLTNGDPIVPSGRPVVDFYYMQNGDEVSITGYRREISRIVVTVNVVVDGTATCSSAEIVNPATEGPFKPC